MYISHISATLKNKAIYKYINDFNCRGSFFVYILMCMVLRTVPVNVEGYLAHKKKGKIENDLAKPYDTYIWI